MLVVHRVHDNVAEQTLQLFVRPDGASSGLADGLADGLAGQEDLDDFVTQSLQSGQVRGQRGPSQPPGRTPGQPAA